MKTPDYVLIEPVSISLADNSLVTLPAGSFVRPIEIKYLHKEVLDNPVNKWFNKEADVFCYCRYGIFRFAKKNIRLAEYD